LDGVTGMVYDPDDPWDLVAALTDALLDREALAGRLAMAVSVAPSRTARSAPAKFPPPRDDRLTRPAVVCPARAPLCR
ncbi:hypothetical protein, partial [Streptomyces tendae]|uniref:hypothetical protein n=1 Tax=Streptomyces tendae TaxID=1932 RepID=UPI0033A1D30C